MAQDAALLDDQSTGAWKSPHPGEVPSSPAAPSSRVAYVAESRQPRCLRRRLGGSARGLEPAEHVIGCIAVNGNVNRANMNVGRQLRSQPELMSLVLAAVAG